MADLLDKGMATPTNVPIENFGPPGTPGDLLVLDVFHGDKRSDDERLTDTTPRLFKVTALLSKTPLSDDGINLSIETERGASYISTHPDAVKSLLKLQEGTIEIRYNSNRELASLHLCCLTTSIKEAKGEFLNSAAPFIDHVSYVGNVPIYISLVECFDEKNQIRSYSYTNPHPHIVINPHKAIIHKRLEPIYALYREAKNGQSPFYRFLCYYKILEGIYKHLRPQIFHDAKEKGINLIKQKELVPNSKELKGSHPNLIGQPIKAVFDSRFTADFRDEAAHYLLSDGDVLNVSDPKTAERFNTELLPIEICSRIVISVQERYEKQLSASSSE